MKTAFTGSPNALARATGLSYLVLTVAALTAEFFVRSRLVVPGDAAATAHNIINSPSLYRLGVVCDLTNLLCDAIVAVLLYQLLWPVARTVAVLAAVLRIIMVCVLASGVVFSLAPLDLLSATAPTSLLTATQSESLALIALQLRGQATNVALVFFGAHLMLVGYLTYRSTFLPRVIGALLGLAGLGYVLNSLIRFAEPGVIEPYFPYLAGLWALAEWSFTFWLLIVGVNAKNLAKVTEDRLASYSATV